MWVSYRVDLRWDWRRTGRGIKQQQDKIATDRNDVTGLILVSVKGDSDGTAVTSATKGLSDNTGANLE